MLRHRTRLSGEEPAGRQVRLRKKGKTASLTFKVGRGSHREEREIKLSPKTIRRALAGDRRQKIAQGALRNSVEKSSDEIDIYQAQTLRSRGGRSGIPRPCQRAANSSHLPGLAGK